MPMIEKLRSSVIRSKSYFQTFFLLPFVLINYIIQSSTPIELAQSKLVQWNDMHIYWTILLGIWVFFFFYFGIRKWRGWDEVYTSFIWSYIKKTIQELKGYRIGLSCILNALIFFKNVFGLVLVFCFVCLFYSTMTDDCSLL